MSDVKVRPPKERKGVKGATIRVAQASESRAFCVFGEWDFSACPLIHIQRARRKSARWRVASSEAKGEGRRRETHLGEVAGGAQRASTRPRWKQDAHDMPQRPLAENNVEAKTDQNNHALYRMSDEHSGTATGILGRSETIRQKIIGRTVAVGGSRGGGRRVIGSRNGAFALFDEPAGEHGCGIFLEPLIEEGTDLLAEIGGVAEAREFVGLQGMARSGEKKLPGSLGTELRHEDLQGRVLWENDAKINTLVIYKAINEAINSLWKTVEKQENATGCCSGCAGDYEDPDWTAWEADIEEVGEVKEVKETPERHGE